MRAPQRRPRGEGYRVTCDPGHAWRGGSRHHRAQLLAHLRPSVVSDGRLGAFRVVGRAKGAGRSNGPGPGSSLCCDQGVCWALSGDLERQRMKGEPCHPPQTMNQRPSTRPFEGPVWHAVRVDGASRQGGYARSLFEAARSLPRRAQAPETDHDHHLATAIIS